MEIKQQKEKKIFVDVKSEPAETRVVKVSVTRDFVKDKDINIQVEKDTD